MASTWRARDLVKEYEAEPTPEKLAELLSYVVDVLEELDYEKQQRPSDELW